MAFHNPDPKIREIERDNARLRAKFFLPNCLAVPGVCFAGFCCTVESGSRAFVA